MWFLTEVPCISSSDSHLFCDILVSFGWLMAPSLEFHIILWAYWREAMKLFFPSAIRTNLLPCLLSTMQQPEDSHVLSACYGVEVSRCIFLAFNFWFNFKSIVHFYFFFYFIEVCYAPCLQSLIFLWFYPHLTNFLLLLSVPTFFFVKLFWTLIWSSWGFKPCDPIFSTLLYCKFQVCVSVQGLRCHLITSHDLFKCEFWVSNINLNLPTETHGIIG